MELKNAPFRSRDGVRGERIVGHEDIEIRQCVAATVRAIPHLNVLNPLHTLQVHLPPRLGLKCRVGDGVMPVIGVSAVARLAPTSNDCPRGPPYERNLSE